MPRLNVRALAEAKGWNMSQLQKESRVTMPSVRRYWYGTKDGKVVGEPLKVVDLTVLAAIAKALGVRTAELIEDDRRALQLAAA
jgi:transcriptional regulator with XRE-family HTH domain